MGTMMRQPRAILPIFFTEMWERFGYYALQALLVLFLVSQLNYSTASAFTLLAEFLSWIYIAPIFGGLIADRILGHRYSILYGTLLLCIGYMLLAFKGGLLLHLSLATLIVGNGLLKPNSPSFLGTFYYHDDPRRYSGFTFYFIGINIGGLISVLLTSVVSTYIGYHTAFAMVGFGMCIAAGVFIYGFRYFENRGMPVARRYIDSPWLKIFSNRLILFMFLIILIQITHFLLHAAKISEITLIVVITSLLTRLFYLQSHYNTETRNKLAVIAILIASSIIFWGIQLQIFFSILVFTTEYVQRHILGVTIPAPLFVILEPGLILLLGPLLATLWNRFALQGKEPSPPVKFALGLLLTGFSMAILVLGIYWTPTGHLIHLAWMILFYIPLTLAGLFIAPTGMAMITELSPKRLTGFIMGVWYMVIGLGGLFAGKLAHLTLAGTTAQYIQAFGIYTLLPLSAGLLLFLYAHRLEKLMR